MTSGRLTPAAATFTSTSPAAGTGRGRSAATSASGPPGALISMAYIATHSEPSGPTNSQSLARRHHEVSPFGHPRRLAAADVARGSRRAAERLPLTALQLEPGQKHRRRITNQRRIRRPPSGAPAFHLRHRRGDDGADAGPPASSRSGSAKQ